MISPTIINMERTDRTAITTTTTATTIIGAPSEALSGSDSTVTICKNKSLLIQVISMDI